MPSKSKSQKQVKEPAAKAPPAESAVTGVAPPRTVHERSQQFLASSRPLEKTRESQGVGSLSTADKSAWISAHLLASSGSVRKLSVKAQRDFWRHVNDTSQPIRAARKQEASQSWGKDAKGKDIGDYTPEEFGGRAAKVVQLTALEVAHRAWLAKDAVSEQDVEEERQRRKEMAALKSELYGRSTTKYAQDPDWDDVEPIPQEDPEDALAAIAYPEHYASATSYLRAVMAKKEYSPRCLRLTEDVISLNPAHYTVWLYRFSIISALDVSIPDEIAWLNEVSLEHLKNYQIWHHRHLLLDKYYPTISSSPEKVAELGKSERRFLSQMFAEDAKNYHVWSYRQYLVQLLGMWNEDELRSVEVMIEEDVRNNSAWSHRFYLVFSDPKHSTPGSHNTEPDPAIPAAVIDREVSYAEDKIRLAPQNQSPWNYLKGVLTKGGRKVSTVEDFAGQFVKNLGKDNSEDVTSSHALDLLAEVYAEKGETEKAALALKRLADKWDRIRAGYWDWRRRELSA